MVTQEKLQSYVKENLEKGHSKEKIHNALIKHGVVKERVELAFKHAHSERKKEKKEAFIKKIKEHKPLKIVIIILIVALLIAGVYFTTKQLMEGSTGIVKTKEVNVELSAECTFPKGLNCIDYKVSREAVTIELQNDFDYPIDEVSVTIEGNCDEGNVAIESKQQETFQCKIEKREKGSIYASTVDITFRDTKFDIVREYTGTITQLVK